MQKKKINIFSPTDGMDTTNLCGGVLREPSHARQSEFGVAMEVLIVDQHNATGGHAAKCSVSNLQPTNQEQIAPHQGCIGRDLKQRHPLSESMPDHVAKILCLSISGTPSTS